MRVWILSLYKASSGLPVGVVSASSSVSLSLLMPMDSEGASRSKAPIDRTSSSEQTQFFSSKS